MLAKNRVQKRSPFIWHLSFLAPPAGHRRLRCHLHVEEVLESYPWCFCVLLHVVALPPPRLRAVNSYSRLILWPCALQRPFVRAAVHTYSGDDYMLQLQRWWRLLSVRRRAVLRAYGWSDRIGCSVLLCTFPQSDVLCMCVRFPAELSILPATVQALCLVGV